MELKWEHGGESELGDFVNPSYLSIMRNGPINFNKRNYLMFSSYYPLNEGASGEGFSDISSRAVVVCGKDL